MKPDGYAEESLQKSANLANGEKAERELFNQLKEMLKYPKLFGTKTYGNNKALEEQTFNRLMQYVWQQ